MIITVDLLKQIAPASKKTAYKLLPDLSEWFTFYFPAYGIDQKGEFRHFLAQAAHETDSFNSLEEYASGAAYDTRTDLGNTPQKDGDGQLFKGRGVFMTTGRRNYAYATLRWNDRHTQPQVDFNAHPELLSEPRYAVWSACEYWQQKDFNAFANMPDDAKIYSKTLKKNLTPLQYITWRINGGQNGFAERKKFYERSKLLIQ